MKKTTMIALALTVFIGAQLLTPSNSRETFLCVVFGILGIKTDASELRTQALELSKF